MRLAMRLPPKKGDGGTGSGGDPRENESAEIIDLASRNGFPAIVDRKAKSDGLGLAAGVAIVGLLGAVTFWAMQSAQIPEQQGVGDPNVAPPQAAAVPEPVEPVAPPQEVAPSEDPAPAPILANNPNVDLAPATNPYASPTMIFDASTGAQGNRLAEALRFVVAQRLLPPGRAPAIAERKVPRRRLQAVLAASAVLRHRPAQ